QPRAREGRREGNPRAGECRFDELLPPAPVAKLGVVPALSRHGAKVERPALVQQLGLRRRSHLEILQAATDSGSLLYMHRIDVVAPSAQDVETAFEARPACRGKSSSEGPGLADHPAQFQGVRIEHGLVWQAHQKTPGNGVPNCTTGSYDP